MNKRKYYNKLIMNHLNKMVEEGPDLRFGQILANLGINRYGIYKPTTEDQFTFIEDNFNEESEEIHNRIKEI